MSTLGTLKSPFEGYILETYRSDRETKRTSKLCVCWGGRRSPSTRAASSRRAARRLGNSVEKTPWRIPLGFTDSHGPFVGSCTHGGSSKSFLETSEIQTYILSFAGGRPLRSDRRRTRVRARRANLRRVSSKAASRNDLDLCESSNRLANGSVGLHRTPSIVQSPTTGLETLSHTFTRLAQSRARARARRAQSQVASFLQKYLSSLRFGHVRMSGVNSRPREIARGVRSSPRSRTRVRARMSPYL